MAVRQMPSDHKFGNKWRAGKRPENAFKPGHEPWNKELKGIHLSPGSEFKKGAPSHRRAPVGHVSIRRDKNGRDRAFVKVAEPNQWKMRAVVAWEAAFGPVPAGMVIHHKDRDSLNDEPSNLQAMTRQEHINEHREEFRHADALPANSGVSPP